MMAYSEDEFLLLSGLQHFAFCKRQWALIHIEQQWTENLHTVEGNFMHERAHDSSLTEFRDGILICRGIQVFSRELGITGACDVVEFHPSPDGVPIVGREGLWCPVPIEYKKGRPKEHDADALQLCAQAMCLEKMLVCTIPGGYLFYGETKRRQPVEFTSELRHTVTDMLNEMHMLYHRGYTPKVKPSKSCNACSLIETCLPKLCKNLSAVQYVNKHLKEEDL